MPNRWGPLHRLLYPWIIKKSNWNIKKNYPFPPLPYFQLVSNKKVGVGSILCSTSNLRGNRQIIIFISSPMLTHYPPSPRSVEWLNLGELDLTDRSSEDRVNGLSDSRSKEDSSARADLLERPVKPVLTPKAKIIRCMQFHSFYFLCQFQDLFVKLLGI